MCVSSLFICFFLYLYIVYCSNIFFILLSVFFFFFFFFSSRRRHTRLTCDWSSDVCSSDLRSRTCRNAAAGSACPMLWSSPRRGVSAGARPMRSCGGSRREQLGHAAQQRSEERRVGKECRSWRAQEP